MPFATSPNISPASRDKICASVRAIILTTTLHLSKSLEDVRKQTLRKLEKKSFPDRGKSESQGTCVRVRVCSQILKTEYLHIVFMLVLSEPKTQERITVENRSFQRAQGMIRWKSKAMFCPEFLNHLFSILRKNSKPNYLKCTGNKATGCVIFFFFFFLVKSHRFAEHYFWKRLQQTSSI